jgi:hypothetical protein
MVNYPPGCRPALRMTDERAGRNASVLTLKSRDQIRNPKHETRNKFECSKR